MAMPKYKNLELRPQMIAILVLLDRDPTSERMHGASTMELGKLVGKGLRWAGHVLEEMKRVGLVTKRQNSDSDVGLVWKLTDDGENWLQEHS